MENVFIFMVLVSASVTVSSKFLGKSENDIVVGIWGILVMSLVSCNFFKSVTWKILNYFEFYDLNL